MIIVLHAASLNSAGGLNVGINLASRMSVNYPNDNIILICPDNKLYKNLNNENIELRIVPYILRKKYLRPFYNLWVHFNIYKTSPDAVFNLSNIPIRTKYRQLVMLHWPYAVYPENEIWKRMKGTSYLNRKVKLFFFKRNLKFANQFTVQTNVMKSRLEKYYGIKKITVVPSSVSFKEIKELPKNKLIENLKKIKSPKFLCLTRYYPHKNIEILLKVAEIIKNENMDFKIILTIDVNQEEATKKIITQIRKKNLDDVLINVGTINFANVASLYDCVDALLLPTLMESFGLTYLEAMYFGKPIFTSDLDFAHEVCNETAIYFDPFSEKDILEKIKLIGNRKLMKEKKDNAHSVLDKGFFSWDSISKQYYSILYDMAHS